ncbi:MAG: PAS domain S-box protein [Rhodocyclaceae bacterium]|nr:MAG: PAS domain S-box protein [Rhodocyclaceae bacterium]
MNPSDTDQQDKRQLRAAAEANLAKRMPSLSFDEGAAKQLLHELQVHQVELEMQNEALRQKQLELEAARNRYVDLYEFAPVGYLTLTAEGLIAELNLTATALLGAARKNLLHRGFRTLVVEADQDRLTQLLMSAKSDSAPARAQLALLRGDGRRLDAQLDCVRASRGVRISLTDITQLRQAEAARHVFEARLSKLTPRERVVLAFAIAGMPNTVIATRLQISLRTVEGHRARIYLKTGVSSLLELSQQAAAAGVSLIDGEA